MMLDLAEHQEDGFVPLKDIAEREDISKKYLEQIIPVLNRAGLLQTSRGSGGGYRLIKPPRDYTVGEIVRAAEGTMAPVSCLEGQTNPCPKCSECATLPIWQGLQSVIDEYLDAISLEDVLNRAGSGD